MFGARFFLEYANIAITKRSCSLLAIRRCLHIEGKWSAQNLQGNALAHTCETSSEPPVECSSVSLDVRDNKWMLAASFYIIDGPRPTRPVFFSSKPLVGFDFCRCVIGGYLTFAFVSLPSIFGRVSVPVGVPIASFRAAGSDGPWPGLRLVPPLGGGRPDGC